MKQVRKIRLVSWIENKEFLSIEINEIKKINEVVIAHIYPRYGL